MTKTVLITGASRGIGRETAKLFAQKGYRTVIHHNRSHCEAKQLFDELKTRGCAVMLVQADIAEPDDVRNMMDLVSKNWGMVDILVNNAGIAQQKMLCDTTEEDWRDIFSINVDGMFRCTKAVLSGMVRNGYGRIINVSSMWGVTGASCEVAYSASKAAIIGFTKALAKEAGPSGITVNCVAPGVIETQMNHDLPAETMAALKEESALGRLGSVFDVAEAVYFLASDKAGFITGEVLNVNGGMVI